MEGGVLSLHPPHCNPPTERQGLEVAFPRGPPSAPTLSDVTDSKLACWQAWPCSPWKAQLWGPRQTDLSQLRLVVPLILANCKTRTSAVLVSPRGCPHQRPRGQHSSRQGLSVPSGTPLPVPGVGLWPPAAEGWRRSRVWLVPPCHFTGGEAEVDYSCSVMGWEYSSQPGRWRPPGQGLKLELGQPEEDSAGRHSGLGEWSHSKRLDCRWQGHTTGEETVAPKGLSPERGPKREATGPRLHSKFVAAPVSCPAGTSCPGHPTPPTAASSPHVPHPHPKQCCCSCPPRPQLPAMAGSTPVTQVASQVSSPSWNSLGFLGLESQTLPPRSPPGLYQLPGTCLPPRGPITFCLNLSLGKPPRPILERALHCPTKTEEGTGRADLSYGVTCGLCLGLSATLCSTLAWA